MSYTRGAFIVSCIAALAGSAAAAPTGTPPGYTMYASTAGEAGGYDYVRVIPDHAVIGALAHPLLSGFFYRDDFTKEYAIDDTATLVTVDTGTAEVTPIGELQVGDWAHLSISVDPSSDLAYALVAENPCTETLLFAVDLNTGAGVLVGPAGGCLEAGAFASDGTYYAIDSEASTLVDVNQGAIGSLGFAVGDEATLFQIQGSATLYLMATDLSTATMNLYAVDTTTGNATLIGPSGGVYTGIAIGPPLPDAVFADGFDG